MAYKIPKLKSNNIDNNAVALNRSNSLPIGGVNNNINTNNGHTELNNNDPTNRSVNKSASVQQQQKNHNRNANNKNNKENNKSVRKGNHRRDGGYGHRGGRDSGYQDRGGRGGGYQDRGSRGGAYQDRGGRDGRHQYRRGRGGGYQERGGRGGGYNRGHSRYDGNGNCGDESYENVHVIGMDENGQRTWFGTYTFCHPHKKRKRANRNYNYILFFFQFLLPMLVLMFAYTRIGLELYQANCTLEDINRSARDSHLCAKWRTAKLFAIMVFCFLGLWTPYQILFTLSLECLANSEWAMCIKVRGNLAFLLAMCSTLVSPIIYYSMSERFYTSFCYALRCLPCWHGKFTRTHYQEVFALNGGGVRISQQPLTPSCCSPALHQQRRCTANRSKLGWRL